MEKGKLTQGIVDNGADFAALGLDPLVLLRTKNSIELGFLMAVADKLVKLREIQNKQLANEIARALSGK